MSNGAGRSLHVGLNGHLLSLAGSYRSAGISWYIHNLLRSLPGADPQVKYTAFLSEKRFGAPPGMSLKHSRLPTYRPPARVFWEQALQPWALHQSQVDLVHGLALVGPLLSACPSVVTVHDLSFLFYPWSFPRLKRLYLKAFTRASVRRARRVIAISENTRQDVIKLYGLAPDRVDMIHYGLDSIFQPLPPERVASWRSEKGLPERFILFVGTLEPRKNVARLVDAYSRLPRSRPPLVLVGGKGWLYGDIFARVEELNLGSDVHFVGHIPGQELPWWYNAAELLVYPSLYEGFGLPPLEAMACGTAVVASNVSSLPEVVGEAGVLVDPYDTGAMTGAIARVLDDQGIREQMQAAGLARARTFSWEQAARHTVGSYRRAMEIGERECLSATGVPSL